MVLYKPEGNQEVHLPYCKTAAKAGTQSSSQQILEIQPKTYNG
jgi:hypothetical protein